MKNLIYLFLFLVFSVNKASAISISWDSGGDGTTWTDPLNWDCNCLPTIGDAVTISYSGASVVIPTGANIQVYSLLSYNIITIQTGAVLRTDFIINLVINGLFTNNGMINAYGEGMLIHDDHQVVNNGTINIEGTDNFISLGFGSGMNPATFTNNGAIIFNNTNLSILEVKANSIFTNTVSGSITFNYATAILNVINGSFVNQGTIDTKGRVINNASFINTGNIYVHDFTEQAINNGSTFQNNGSVLVNTPGSGALFCINNSGTITGSGSFDLSGLNILNNTSSGNITFGGSLQTTGVLGFGGIFNLGTIAFDNVAISNINCPFNNQPTGTITIQSCRRVKVNANWNNSGTLTNNGLFELNFAGFVSNNVFVNHGIYVSSLPLPDNSPSSNIGIHLFKVYNQQCAGTDIPLIYTGMGTDITNTPTGIFTDIGLTTSAGSFNFGTRTFTPSVACHGLDKLYISLQKSGCSPVIVPWAFDLPIYAPITYYADTDFDGFGDVANPFLVTCGVAPYGYSTFSTDCDDSNPDVYPGAPEICNDKDYNCDGMITGFNPASIWYRDFDNDGYGNAALSITNCNLVIGYVSNDDDCDDNDFSINPLAMESCNNIDDDCDGLIDEDFPPTSVTFNGSSSSDWFDPTNWTPALVPANCIDAIVPAGMIVTASIVNGTATCRSLSIAATSMVSINNNVQFNIIGGTAFGISIAGTLTLNDQSSTSIQYINGNGIENSNVFTMNNDAYLYINRTSASCIRNLSSGTCTIGNSNFLDMNAATENAIYNSGIFSRNGFFNANNIAGSTIKNNGTFNNEGDLFINAFGLPGWFVENLSGGVINNTVGKIWTFPVPGSFYNVSDQGLLNHLGSTFNNYGTVQFFGHRISGTGAFISHPGSIVQGCVPGLGCP